MHLLSELAAALKNELPANTIAIRFDPDVSFRTPEDRDLFNYGMKTVAEAIRAASLKITPHAMLSRGVSVIRNRTLIINLPGSPKAVEESMDVIAKALPHGLAILTGRGDN